MQFDERVKVQGPGFAEDPMNVPITVSATGLAGVERIMVLVDRNPTAVEIARARLAAEADRGGGSPKAGR